MNRIDRIFAEARAEGRKLLMPFVCGGRPTLNETPRLLTALESAGASIIEVGFPFSDPIADGPVIAASMHRALLDRITPNGIFEAIKHARNTRDSPLGLGLIAMVSMSIVGKVGVDRFAQQAVDAGIDGLIVPDCPVEESEQLGRVAKDAGLTLSLLVAPTTTGERLERIVGACSGFVYLMARLGITGESGGGPANVEARVARIRAISDLPIACGFGISTPEQVAEVTRHADAAIVGSALVKRMEAAIDDGQDAVSEAERFTAELASGLC